MRSVVGSLSDYIYIFFFFLLARFVKEHHHTTLSSEKEKQGCLNKDSQIKKMVQTQYIKLFSSKHTLIVSFDGSDMFLKSGDVVGQRTSRAGDRPVPQVDWFIGNE